jgi:hypothetical protein
MERLFIMRFAAVMFRSFETCAKTEICSKLAWRFVRH